MTWISSNMAWVSFGTSRVIKKKSSREKFKPANTCLLRVTSTIWAIGLHNDSVLFIVMKGTVLYYHSAELHHDAMLGHWSFRISISSSLALLCFICFLCIVYKIETMASFSKSEVQWCIGGRARQGESLVVPITSKVFFRHFSAL